MDFNYSKFVQHGTQVNRPTIPLVCICIWAISSDSNWFYSAQVTQFIAINSEKTWQVKVKKKKKKGFWYKQKEEIPVWLLLLKYYNTAVQTNKSHKQFGRKTCEVCLSEKSAPRAEREHFPPIFMGQVRKRCWTQTDNAWGQGCLDHRRLLSAALW